MCDVLVRAQGVSKKFSRSIRSSMWYGINDIAHNVAGFGSHPHRLRKNEFWAIDDVSFELRRGETLGVIGPNGSGKTTLLKMLNGIFWPDKGKVSIRGSVGALIEVGAGFHPLLTGRENIYLNGSILGMKKDHIDRYFDEIVSFADVGEFLDTPVKHYSSGMFVRLGFSIAVHSEPDILLIDEILAVGDIGFRSKCYNKIVELQQRCAVIVVTHDIHNIFRITSRTMVIHNGRNVFDGGSAEAATQYMSIFGRGMAAAISNGVRVASFRLRAPVVDGIHQVAFSSSLEIDIGMDSDLQTCPVQFICTFTSTTGDFVGEWNSWMNDCPVRLEQGESQHSLSIGPVRLNPGIYDMNFVVVSERLMEHLLILESAARFRVDSERIGKAPYQIAGRVTS
jgi:lipopolysaccharide transport system ATP-binding protein